MPRHDESKELEFFFVPGRMKWSPGPSPSHQVIHALQEECERLNRCFLNGAAATFTVETESHPLYLAACTGQPE